MKSPYCIKVCSKCKRILVANSGNFSKAKGKKYGLRGECKACNKQYKENNKEKIAEYNKQYYQDNKEHYAERSKQYRKDNKEKIAEINKEYRKNNKEKIAEYQKEYYSNNKEDIIERSKQYYEDNKEKIAEYKKQYYQDNKEHYAERSKQYHQDNPHIVFNYTSKRRSKEENQGNGISKEQWLDVMNFFEWKCAYSDITLNKDTRTIDHIVPLDKNGENEIWNLVPMYKNLNSSKNTKDMLDWYKQQDFYSEERLNKIYQWIEYAYSKWGV